MFRTSITIYLSQNQYQNDFLYDPYRRQRQYANLYLSFGKEYYKWSGKKQKLRLYGGWAILGQYYSNSSKWFYEYESPQPQEGSGPYTIYRDIENREGSSIKLGLGGFAGTEYYFTPQFFVGVELSMGLLMGYRLESKTIEEEWRLTNFGSEKYELEKSTEISTNGGIEYELDTSNPILFRAGFVF